MGAAILLGDLDGAVCDHLRKALSVHFTWCRTNGITVPSELRSLFDVVDSGGQARPTRAPIARPGEDADMRLLALTYDQAAARLNVSARTVRRLVGSGRLPAVGIASARRIRSADLAAYADGLETTK